jgi:uncharacterized protein (TIGR00255 family)
MLKSMTAYGRGCLVSSLGRFVAELHSVNRKHLEINTYLPKEFLRYDGEIKKWISAKVGRGQINAKITVSFAQSSPIVITPNMAMVRQIKDAWDFIAKELAVSFSEETFLTVLSKESGILIYDEEILDERLYRDALHEIVIQALEQLFSMKLSEGRVLYEEISMRFSKLSQLIKNIADKAPGATQRYRQRLLERLEELLGKSIENEERILREIGIYAERIDIAEELTRFESHLLQANELIHDKEQSVGKPLEFLLQELNREINTIGSKSSDVEVARLVIEIKSELERIREQIQNIE